MTGSRPDRPAVNDRFLIRIRLQVRQPGEHLLEHHSLQLPRHVVPEAEMHPP